MGTVIYYNLECPKASYARKMQDTEILVNAGKAAIVR